MLHTDEPTPCQSQRPELWFSKETEKIALAKALCMQCTQQLRCLREVLETEEMLGMRLAGVHGGLDQSQRSQTTINRIA